MKFLRVFLLSLFAVLLCASVFIAQFAFRIERSVLSYAYMSGELETVLEPLSDSALHSETIEGAFSYIRSRLAMSVPWELESYIVEAAVVGFSENWIRQTARQMLYSFFQIVDGSENRLNLAVNIGNFKNSFLNIVRANAEPDYVKAVSMEMNRMPSIIRLEDEIPAETQNRIVQIIRRSRAMLIVLQYVIPGILILLCFAFRRLGSALTAIGSALFVSGTAAVLSARLWFPASEVNLVELLVRRSPDFLGWIIENVGQSVLRIMLSVIPTAIVVLSVGSALAALGIVLIANGKDAFFQQD